jgi:hypothetical protein
MCSYRSSSFKILVAARRLWPERLGRRFDIFRILGRSFANLAGLPGFAHPPFLMHVALLSLETLQGIIARCRSGMVYVSRNILSCSGSMPHPGLFHYSAPGRALHAGLDHIRASCRPHKSCDDGYVVTIVRRSDRVSDRLRQPGVIDGGQSDSPRALIKVFARLLQARTCAR